MRKAILQAWLLVGGLILTLTLNGLANALPLFGRMTGEISDSLPNLFVPSGLTFSIWGVIYLGLLAFSLYQLGRAYKTPDALPAWLSAIAPWVIISHIANAAWIIAWHALQYTISVVLMIILFIALMKTMTKLKWSKNALSGKEFWLVCVPFSLYSGWITVALPANITSLLVANGISSISPGPAFWAAALAAIAAILAITAVLRHRDSAYALVISWALLGIALARATAEPWLSGWAAALALLTLLVALLAPMLMRRPDTYQ